MIDPDDEVSYDGDEAETDGGQPSQDCAEL